MSNGTTLHFWSAIGSILTPLLILFLAFVFRSMAKWTAGLVNATKANTAAVAKLTSELNGTTANVTKLSGDVGELHTRTALNTEHIKHNTSRITKLEKEIRA